MLSFEAGKGNAAATSPPAATLPNSLRVSALATKVREAVIDSWITFSRAAVAE